MQDFFMKFAIDLAKHSRRIGEIPVGCVIVDDKNKMVSYAFNSMKKNHDPTAHAEIIAIRKACNKLKTTKLLGFSLYVTLEPCLMCESAIINVGIKKIYFGAYSDNLKSHRSKLKNYFSPKKDYELLGGFQESYCSKLITDTLKRKR